MRTNCLLVMIVALLASDLQAAITLPSYFGDHMVLQRGAQVPIWGKADPGEKVTITFGKQVVSAKADDEGAWRIELEPLAASGEPQTLNVVGDKSRAEIALKSVLVGDVWVGSGQSNMAGRVASYAKNDKTLAALAKRESFPHIRLMAGGPKPVWKQATQQNVNGFSALHFSFGERLQRDLDVPIGLIVGAVGGTPSGYWIPPQTYASSKKCEAAVAEFSANYDEAAAKQKHIAQLAAWEKRVAAAKADGKRVRGRKPTPPVRPGESSRGGKIGGLYRRFIEPVAGYRIRGVLWDQGEARSGVLGVDQHTMMSELIRGWRDAWGQGDFAFLFVQKPSGGGCAFSNDNPITRNAERFIEALPDLARIGSGEQRFLYVRLMRDNKNAWMTPASDLGAGIHPTNKWGYGNRAAEVALSQVYKQDIQAYGPVYRSHKIEGGKVTITFEHVGKGLISAHSSTLQGFALAAEDGKWHWAEASIDGDKVVVSSRNVPKPSRIRYAFAQKRAWANLFNKDGLPALSFEATD